MSIHVQCGKNTINSNTDAKIQSMPFKIHADFDAKVTKYFNEYVKKTEYGVKCSFRGYPLNGKVMELPEGYKGLVLQETVRPVTDKEERNFYVTNTFKDLTFWNWDTIPSKNDAFAQAIEWIDIAEALHSPIVEE